MSDLRGFDELQRRLERLGTPRQVKQIARQALTAGQRVVVRSIKSKIPGVYKDARKAVGQSLKRSRFGENAGMVAAKVGFGVGKKVQTDAEMQAAGKRRKSSSGGGVGVKNKGKTRSGVGLSARNVHWAVLGTDDRYTGQTTRRARGGVRITKRGTGKRRYSGRMPAILAGVVKSGLQSSSTEAVAKIKEKMGDGIRRLGGVI